MTNLLYTYHCHLQIQAREVGTTPMRSSEPLTLTIHVLDLNDNSPSFQSQSYHVFVAPNVNQQNVIEAIYWNKVYIENVF